MAAPRPPPSSGRAGDAAARMVAPPPSPGHGVLGRHGASDTSALGGFGGSGGGKIDDAPTAEEGERKHSGELDCAADDGAAVGAPFVVPRMKLRRDKLSPWAKHVGRVVRYWAVLSPRFEEFAASLAEDAARLPDEASRVLTFWFWCGSADLLRPATHGGTELAPTSTEADALWRARWFAKGVDQKHVDAAMDEDFGPLLSAAGRGELTEAWTRGTTSPLGVLALIVVLDQFSRNIHRGTADAWATDAAALALCRAAIMRGLDKQLPCMLRAQLYMPLVHAEDLDLQRECRRVYDALYAEGAPSLQPFFERFLYVAKRHHDAIAAFSRFPERNQYLGRRDTPAERAYLEGAQDSKTVTYDM